MSTRVEPRAGDLLVLPLDVPVPSGWTALPALGFMLKIATGDDYPSDVKVYRQVGGPFIAPRKKSKSGEKLGCRISD